MVGVGNVGHRLRPGKRRAFDVVEQRTALAPSGDQHKLLDRHAVLQQVTRMHVDAVGAAVDLRGAKEDKIDKCLPAGRYA
jgi:hypothetical protein